MHLFRLRGDFTTGPTFAARGVATGTNNFVGFDEPSVHADDLGRVLVFEYVAAIKKVRTGPLRVMAGPDPRIRRFNRLHPL